MVKKTLRRLGGLLKAKGDDAAPRGLSHVRHPRGSYICPAGCRGKLCRRENIIPVKSIHVYEKIFEMSGRNQLRYMYRQSDHRDFIVIRGSGDTRDEHSASLGFLDVSGLTVPKLEQVVEGEDKDSKW
ncbi:unnamed protein product [Nezara viridula]|uniref:Uncharacterized protein n=1 Tax=Nezara viridula TaxID=85310 RepID=A0A9P0MRN1_NEZVI|nr:unnamed protein product [Nezara viridula]